MSRADTRGIKIMNLGIMLINSNETTYFPKGYYMEAWILMSVLDVIYQRFLYMLLLQIEYCSWFMIWSDIYYFLFWVGRWYPLSTCVCTDPYLYVSFFVICGVQQTCRRLQLNQSSLHRISGWANSSSLDWIFFFMSWCLEVPVWTSFLFMFSFLDTLSLSN